MVLFIINFVTGWSWMVSCLSPLNHQGKSPQYPLTRRLGEPWSHSCLFGEDKKTFIPVRHWTMIPPSANLYPWSVCCSSSAKV